MEAEMEPTVSMEEFARDPIKWLEQARAKEENFLISDHGELIAQVIPIRPQLIDCVK
jgi:antitoxin (DNA-binding transcriptional repressor) of toxin-antitoxin stability system